MPSGGLDIYLNPDSSQNADGLTATYTLTDPSGTTTIISPATDADDKQYFTLQKSVAAGEYKVTLSYDTGGDVTSTIPGSAYFDVLTDAVSPTASVSISGPTASLSFTNTAGIGSMVYTSSLDSYAVYIGTSSLQPTLDESDYTAVSGTTTSVNLTTVAGGQSLTLETGTTYYLHVLLKDAAGNVGHTARSFSLSAPSATFTGDSAGIYTSADPYTGDSVTFDLTPGTYEIVSYRYATGDSEPASKAYTTVSVDDGNTTVRAEYGLPTGEYRLWIKAVDIQGYESAPISIYINAKKYQILSGTDSYVFEAGVDTGATLDYTSSSSPDLEGAETLGAITYAETTDPNNVISLSGDSLTINDYLGTATITVTAAANATHREATDLITVRVVKPFTVSLTASGYDANTGITIVPAYTDQGGFGVGSDRELKYRKVGTATWTIVPLEDWSWGTGYTVAFNGLAAGTDYEVLLSGENARATATTDTAILLFKTPAASAGGTGTITLKDTENGDPYYVSINRGNTVWNSDIVTGDGGDITYTFEDLPDGFYNIVVAHDDETVTKLIEIKNGAQVAGEIAIEFRGTTSTRLRMNGDKSPAIAADNLDTLFGSTTNTDDTAGVTAVDNAILASGGAIQIELVSTGLDESDIPGDIAKINNIKGSQSLAVLVDLSLYKTVWEMNASRGTTSKIKSTSNKIMIAIPLNNINGSNVKIYRVHEDVAQVIPEATLAADNITYVWADDYQLDGPITLTKGTPLGDEEYVVINDGYAVLYVNKFSTYAIAYTPSISSGSSRSSTTKTVSVSAAEHGTVSIDSIGQRAGSTVTITITPDDGYVLSKLIISDADGNAIAYTQTSDGKYQFTMPSSEVVIKAEFAMEQTKAADPADTGVANWLITDKHIGSDYKANRYITRAEFAAMAMRFATIAGGNARFSDVRDTNWAYQYIMSAAGYGWIGGYSDGTFKPQKFITRAEVVTIVNNMLGRSADKEYIDSNPDELNKFPDVTKNSYWAYYGIIEATSAHEFDTSSGEEVWAKIK